MNVLNQLGDFSNGLTPVERDALRAKLAELDDEFEA